MSKAGAKSASDHPRRISVDSKDDVARAAYERAGEQLTGAALVKAFAHPVVADLEIDREQIAGVHRDVDP